MSWCSSGEGPRMVAGADGSASVTAAEELADEFVKGRGQLQRGGAEQQPDPGRGISDLITGEAGDAGQRLSVEQHEQAGHPVLDGVAVVVEQAADQRPPVVVFARVSVSLRAGRGMSRPRVWPRLVAQATKARAW